MFCSLGHFCARCVCGRRARQLQVWRNTGANCFLPLLNSAFLFLFFFGRATCLWHWRWNRWRWQTPVRTGKPHSIVAVPWLIVNLLASVVAFSSFFPSQSGYSLMKGASVPLAKETRMLLSVPAAEMATLIGHSTQPVAPSHVWPTRLMFWLSFFVCVLTKHKSHFFPSKPLILSFSLILLSYIYHFWSNQL